MKVAEVKRQVTVIANSNTLTPQQVTLLKSLRDNVGLDFNLRRAAADLLHDKQIDGIRQSYIK